MKTFLFAAVLLSVVGGFAFADTPPPGTVKAKLFSGDGNTAIGATGSSLNVNVTNVTPPSTVDQGSAGTDPWLVSVSSSVLPTNACKETGGNLATIASELASPLAVTGTFWQTTQPVSAASLPLPSGAATSAKQPSLGTAGTPSGDVISIQGVSGMTAVKVDASGTTVPVSGTFWQATQPVSGTFWQTTQPVSLASLPSLAAGANTIGAVNINGTVPVSGTITATNSANGSTGSTVPAAATQVGGKDGSGNLRALSVSTAGVLAVDNSANTQPISAASLPLPTGAASETTLSAMNAKVPSLGQALSAASVPVVLPAAQITTLTPPTTITANIGTSGSLALDASVTGLQVSQGSTTSGQKGGLALGAVTTAAPSYTTAQSSPFSLTTGGALRVDASAATVPVSGTFWQATQPASLASLPSLAAGSALIGKVGIDQTTPGTTNGVQINAALPAGSNVIGHVIVDTAPTTAVTQSGTWTVQPGNTANTTAWLVNAVPKTPAALTVSQAAVTIGTSAVRLTHDGLVPPSTRVLLVAQLLSSSTANCYFGSSGVTTTSTTRGVQMFAGQVFSFANDAGDYYAICDATSQTFLITEQE